MFVKSLMTWWKVILERKSLPKMTRREYSSVTIVKLLMNLLKVKSLMENLLMEIHFEVNCVAKIFFTMLLKMYQRKLPKLVKVPDRFYKELKVMLHDIHIKLLPQEL